MLPVLAVGTFDAIVLTCSIFQVIRMGTHESQSGLDKVDRGSQPRRARQWLAIQLKSEGEFKRTDDAF